MVPGIMETWMQRKQGGQQHPISHDYFSLSSVTDVLHKMKRKEVLLSLRFMRVETPRRALDIYSKAAMKI